MLKKVNFLKITNQKATQNMNKILANCPKQYNLTLTNTIKKPNEK